ncbi:hypothetical protein [Aeromonas molluscorum]|uniref:hypothetical protein n=1 Tax=Aeromonas molluscorum TaxID=271417 RepID=UPI003F19D73E
MPDESSFCLSAFICGLLAADFTVQMLTKLLPVGIEINKGVASGAIVAAAKVWLKGEAWQWAAVCLLSMLVEFAMNAIHLTPERLETLFSRIGRGKMTPTNPTYAMQGG